MSKTATARKRSARSAEASKAPKAPEKPRVSDEQIKAERAQKDMLAKRYKHGELRDLQRQGIHADVVAGEPVRFEPQMRSPIGGYPGGLGLAAVAVDPSSRPLEFELIDLGKLPKEYFAPGGLVKGQVPQAIYRKQVYRLARRRPLWVSDKGQGPTLDEALARAGE